MEMPPTLYIGENYFKNCIRPKFSSSKVNTITYATVLFYMKQWNDDDDDDDNNNNNIHISVL